MSTTLPQSWPPLFFLLLTRGQQAAEDGACEVRPECQQLLEVTHGRRAIQVQPMGTRPDGKEADSREISKRG